MDADGAKQAALADFRNKLLQHRELDGRTRQRASRGRARAGEGDGGPRTGGDLRSPRAGAGAGARQGWAAVAARGRARVGWRRRMLRSPMLTLPMALPLSLMRPPRAPRSS